MPVSKKKRTTSTAIPPPSEPPSLVVPDQQEFHQHLRARAQGVVKQVIETVMIEELDAVSGATRNGSYTRALITSTGKSEEVKVPRDREGQFHTQAFERSSRFEPHIARSA